MRTQVENARYSRGTPSWRPAAGGGLATWGSYRVKSGQSRFAAVSPYALFSSADVVSARDAVKRIDQLFKALSDGGTTAIAWHSSACGKALYHTKVATPFSGDPHAAGRRIAAMLASVDFLKAAIEAAGKRRLELAVVARPYDDYFPGLASAFEAAHQECLWESRDGQMRLRGVLSLSYDEVVAYRLQVIEELAAYGADEVIIDLATMAASMTPIRRRDFFGFNAPIAEEHRRRFGQDIRAFDDVDYRRGPDLEIVDAVFFGGEFNREGWHEIKGEFFERFLIAASGIVKSAGQRAGFSRGYQEEILPMARMRLAADQWLSKGHIDDLFLPSGAGEDRDINTYISARQRGQRVITGAETEGCDGTITWPVEAWGPVSGGGDKPA
jgi:hypothetical protein